MKSTPWKLVLLLVGIFVAGALVGGALAVRLGPELFRKHAAPEQWGPARLEMLQRRLDLTPQQVEVLAPIVKRNVEELARFRQESIAQTRSLVERMEREISAQLTPEQRQKYEKLNEERRERLRRAIEQRREGGKHGGRRGAGDGGESPPPERAPGDR